MAVSLTKQQLLAELIESLVAENPGEPIQINSADKTLGFFFPTYVSSRSTPPHLTPEHRAEIKRRHENMDDEVSCEEMVEMVMKDLRQSTPER